jgi:hypothetical protein
VAAAAAAQVEEEDMEDDKEVLAIIERTGGEGKGDNKNKGDDEDIFKIIEAFKE